MPEVLLPGLTGKHTLERRAEQFRKKSIRSYALVYVEPDGSIKTDYEFNDGPPSVKEFGQMMYGVLQLHAHFRAIVEKNIVDQNIALQSKQ